MASVGILSYIEAQDITNPLTLRVGDAIMQEAGDVALLTGFAIEDPPELLYADHKINLASFVSIKIAEGMKPEDIALYIEQIRLNTSWEPITKP